MLHFTEVASASGIDFVRTAPPRPAPPEGQPATPPQVMMDMDPSDPRALMLTRAMSGGGAVLDFHRDGLFDLFLVGVDSGPDRLYRNGGDGSFTDVGEAAGLAREHLGSGALPPTTTETAGSICT